jgi:DNA polymerase-3 subunit delta
VKLGKRPEIERAVDRPDPAVRFWLFYGPDEAGSRALADRLGKAIGADVERIDLDGAQLSKDPALLADEAASVSLFGGARWIRVRANGDEVTAAAEALLEAPQAGNPVAILAGALKPASKLLKLALAAPNVIAFASYAPEGAEADRVAIDLARNHGLRIQPDVARRLVEAAGGDRAVIERELEKLANFLDAGPEAPREVDLEALDAIGAGEGESSPQALVDAALTGAGRQAAEELEALAGDGSESIPLVRAGLRRVLQLAAFRADAQARGSIDAALAAAGKSLFWKEKAVVEAELHRWDAAGLATIVERLTDTQARLMASNNAGGVLAAHELLAIARAAAARRR